MEEKNPSYVEGILNTLSDLEKKSETLSLEVEEMKKQLISISYDEIESIKNQVINTANKEAQIIIETSKQEAEKESQRISEECANELSIISKNIDSSFNKAVEMVFQKIKSDFILANNNSNANSSIVKKTENLQNTIISGTTKRSK